MALMQRIVVVTCVLAITNSATLENVMPSEVANCINRLTPLLNSSDQRRVPGLGTPEEVYLYCLTQFVWRADMVRWEEYNITKKDKDFVNDLLASMMKQGMPTSRNKRGVPPPPTPTPPTGFRIRKEYRVLKDSERNAFHSVLQTMKTNGQYDTFANLHRGAVERSAHGGPNFLGWHRVYLVLIEEAMRKIDITVSLPYWDSTLDFGMDNPANTILFSPEFLGNRYGLVTTGPFANWTAPIALLRRNIGGTGRLFTSAFINLILTRCRTRQITAPNATTTYDLELAHGGIHVWVGGHMRGLNTAAHDPVFFLHHAFVDNIWERFPNHQLSDCNVNPASDYPQVTGQHAANRQMDGLPPYRNIHGYRNFWTTSLYRYEPALRCPPCGETPYITCRADVCVSTERRLVPQEGSRLNGNFAFAPSQTAVSEDAVEARKLEEELDVGPVFRSPPAEPRTQMAQLG